MFELYLEYDFLFDKGGIINTLYLVIQSNIKIMTDKISTQMRKGILEYIILGIIDKGDIYGAEILDVLKNSDLIVVEGTIYPLLSRLKKEELISYYRIESESGHPRKYYKLTNEGKNTLIIMEKTWGDIKTSIKKILNK